MSTTKDEVRGTFGGLRYPTSRPADLEAVLAGGASQGVVAAPTRTPARSAGANYGPAPVNEKAAANAVRGVFGGLGAGGSASPSTDFESAALNVGAATVTGAAAGYMYGGPLGAAVGGGVGLLTSGLNAWLQVSAENKRRSEMDALIRELQAKEDAREKRDRADELGVLKYNRKQAELEQAWGVAQATRAQVNSMVEKNQTLRDRWVKTGSVQ